MYNYDNCFRKYVARLNDNENLVELVGWCRSIVVDDDEFVKKITAIEIRKIAQLVLTGCG